MSVRERALEIAGDLVGRGLVAALRFDPGQAVASALDKLQPWHVETGTHFSGDRRIVCTIKRHNETGVMKVEIATALNPHHVHTVIELIPQPFGQPEIWRGYSKTGDRLIPLHEQEVTHYRGRLGF